MQHLCKVNEELVEAGYLNIGLLCCNFMMRIIVTKLVDYSNLWLHSNKNRLKHCLCGQNSQNFYKPVRLTPRITSSVRFPRWSRILPSQQILPSTL